MTIISYEAILKVRSHRQSVNILYRRSIPKLYMTTIGSSEYPEISFTEALEIIQKIKSKNIKTTEALAGELGYSTKSVGGTFYYKLAALSKYYGLVERTRKDLTFTPLGKRILFPLNDSDRAAAINEAIGRVSLFQSLFASLGRDYHESDFRPKLSETTGAKPDEISDVAGTIERLYKDADGHLTSTSRTTAPKSQPTIGGKDDRRESPPPGRDQGGRGSLPEFDGPVRNLHSEDGYFIRIVLNKEVIDEAIVVLDALKKHLGSKSPSLAPAEE